MRVVTTAPHPATLDPMRLRVDFPILARHVRGGRRLAYLDNAATTQSPEAVLDAIRDYYTTSNANVHRALHQLAEEATVAYEDARKTVASFIGAPSPRSIVFTRGTTEGVNLVAAGWGRRFVKAGDAIVVTRMEHHSNLVPWQRLAAETGATLRFIPMRDDGTLDLDALPALLDDRARIIAVTHVSNVLGTRNPIETITSMARERGVRVLVDGAQSTPHMSIDVRSLGCDFLAFSGHKMLGPMGIGVLYGDEDLLAVMDPFMTGGEMISAVHDESATWAEPPHKFEAGTPNVGGAIGLAAAIRYLQKIGMAAVQRYTGELSGYAYERLRAIDGVTVHGAAADRHGAISFSVDGVHPHDLTTLVDQAGVAIRGGHLCAQPLMRRLGVPSVSRASVYVYNLHDEIDQLVDAIGEAREFFSR